MAGHKFLQKLWPGQPHWSGTVTVTFAAAGNGLTHRAGGNTLSSFPTGASDARTSSKSDATLVVCGGDEPCGAGIGGCILCGVWGKRGILKDFSKRG